MTREYFTRNPKANHPTPADQPRRAWHPVDVIVGVALAIFIVWCVAYGNGVPG